MTELARAFPEGLEYSVPFDTTVFVQTSIDELYKTLIEAGVLVLLIKNHQLSWWFDGEPLKAVLKDSATFGMGLWDH